MQVECSDVFFSSEQKMFFSRFLLKHFFKCVKARVRVLDVKICLGEICARICERCEKKLGKKGDKIHLM